jgi:hypothetical protein
MKLTVFDREASTMAGMRDRLANILEDETRFGMGCEFKQRREHGVMDEDWSVSTDHPAPSRQGVGAARHHRLRQPFRGIRRVHDSRRRGAHEALRSERLTFLSDPCAWSGR